MMVRQFAWKAKASAKCKLLWAELIIYLILITLFLATNSTNAGSATFQPETAAATTTTANATGVPNITSKAAEDQEPISRELERKQHDASAAGQQWLQSAASNQQANDEDIVISASEILTDNNGPHQSRPTRLFVTGSSATIATNLTADNLGHHHRQADADANSGQRQMDNDKFSDIVAYPRPIHRLLFVILFGLVSISLGTLYMVKCCGCRRRKRLNLLQRNLVMDVSLAPTPPLMPSVGSLSRSPANGQDFYLAECSCLRQALPGSPSNNGGFIQSLLRSSLWSSLNGGPTAHQQLRPGSTHQQASSVPINAMLHQQLALAERVALHQLIAANGLGALSSPSPHPHLAAQQVAAAAATGCSSCLISGADGAAPRPHQLSALHWPASLDSLPRPPAYSELFEAGANSLQLTRPPAIDSPAQTTSPGQPEEVADRLQLNPVGRETPSTSASETHTSASSSGTASISEQQQRNLLVKLNLNKTKLFSVDDLVLLSKLIDVPIVVQQEQQAVVDSAEGETSATTTIEELIGETRQDEAGHSESLQTGGKVPTDSMHRRLDTGATEGRPVYQVDLEEGEEREG